MLNIKTKFTGHIMRENNIAAKVDNDEITEITSMAPIYIQRTKNFNQWLTDRGADTSRSYVRIILRQLGLPQIDIKQATKFVHAASLTDTFWIKDINENLQYKDTVFNKDNPYFKAALQGSADIFELPMVKTPEVVNIGSFNKGWRVKNGKWILYKAGTPLEIFSELFTSKLAEALGLNAVHYYIDEGFIACENFVQAGDCFEHAKSLIGEDTDYKKNAEIMTELGFLKEYMDIIFMDAIVRNGDRHEFNYGILTNPKGIAQLAPNFDNNLALFHNGIPTVLSRKDVMVTDFIKVLKLFNYTPPILSENILREVIKKTMTEFPVDIHEQVLLDFCLNAYKQIRSS